MCGHAIGLRPAQYEIVLHAEQAGDCMSIIAGADLVALFSPPYQLSAASVSDRFISTEVARANRQGGALHDR